MSKNLVSCTAFIRSGKPRLRLHFVEVSLPTKITRYSRTSIIRLGSFYNLENGRVPEMRMRIAAVTMVTGLFIFCACADNHVALLFINKVGGSRRGLSIWYIHLSGLPLEPRCSDNGGSTVYGIRC